MISFAARRQISLKVLLVSVFFIMVQLLIAQPHGIFETRVADAHYSATVAVYVPEDFAGRQVPLIIGLHPSQTPAWTMHEMLLPAAIKLGAILVCPESADLDSHVINLMLELFSGVYAVDRNRIVLTGYSVGAYAALTVAALKPARYAGVIAIAPANTAAFLAADELGDTPVSFIIGQADSLLSGTRQLAVQLLARNKKILQIEVPGVEHIDSYFWTDAFIDDWLSCWFFCLEN